MKIMVAKPACSATEPEDGGAPARRSELGDGRLAGQVEKLLVHRVEEPPQRGDDEHKPLVSRQPLPPGTVIELARAARRAASSKCISGWLQQVRPSDDSQGEGGSSTRVVASIHDQTMPGRRSQPSGPRARDEVPSRACRSRAKIDIMRPWTWLILIVQARS